MNHIKRFIDFLLFGNLYIALGAFLLSQCTIIELQLNTSFSYSILVFFATLFIYNLQRIFYKKTINSEPISVRRKWISENQKTIITLAIIGLIGTGVSLFYCESKTTLYLSPLCILSIGYFFPSVQLRKFALLKIFILVSVWTATCYIVPILLSNNTYTSVYSIYSLSGFCFLAAICLPFDNRDIEIDKKENTQTFSILFGSSNVNLSAFIFAVASISLHLFCDFNKTILFINLIVFFSCILFILKNNKPRNEYYYTAGIDGILILKGILCYALI
jgi:4-hydroxybenzoate polyprenyltransferase